MPSSRLSLRESEVVKMVLEFLDNRRLHISQLSLERETGVINGRHSDDMLFLRQLILDGQWDDVLEFVQPLEGIEGFDAKRFKYIVCRHKYEELLCIRSEMVTAVDGSASVDVAVEGMVKCLEDMEKLASSKDEYSSLCLLLTLPKLTDHPEYRDWNPSGARVQCFRSIYPLVDKYLPSNTTPPVKGKGHNSQFSMAKNDRLVQLIIKGALYEACVEFCQQKATGTIGSTGLSSKGDGDFIHLAGLLEKDGSEGFTDADLSLPSWLQSIPHDIFACPFEQRTLNVDVETLQRPGLEASWSEHILVTPIKPRTFPHSAMPNMTRSSNVVMSRSLNPQLDGLPFGLTASSNRRHLMTISVQGDMSSMSKSFAGFHLTGKKSMNTSVDQLFEGLEQHNQSHDNASDESGLNFSYGDLPPVLGEKVAAATATAATTKSSVRESSNLNGSGTKPPIAKIETTSHEKVVVSTKGVKRDGDIVQHLEKDAKLMNPSPSLVMVDQHHQQHSIKRVPGPATAVIDSPELYKGYQRQKLKIQEELANQERKREEYLKQLMEIEQVGQQIVDNRLMNEEEEDFDHIEAEQATSTNQLPSNFQRLVKMNPRLSITDPLSTSTPKPNCVMKPPAVPPTSTPPIIKKPPVAIQSDKTFTKMPQLSSEQNLYATQIDEQPVQQCRMSTPQQLKAKHGYMDSNRASVVNSSNGSTSNADNAEGGATHGGCLSGSGPKPKFIPVTSLEDVQAIRAAEFHPNGKLYAIGSNSKTLRVCQYPKMNDLRGDHETYQPTVLFKRTRHHKGSIYCLAWNATGDLLATGSNDKTVRLMRFNSDNCNVEGDDFELTMHDGTVRDVCFIEDMTNKSSLLISGGAGDCKIYVTDCATGTPFQALSGHSGHILALYTWGGAMFVSGSQDRTIRFWDLRSRGCVNVIPSPPPAGAIKGSAVATVAVDPSGRMLVSGQEDASCMLYDIRGNRVIQCFKPHAADIRTIRFSPRAYYLLSGSYDNKVVLTDLQGDLTLPLPSLVVSEHQDKVIQCRWHPTDFAYLSTSADKTATLWALPPN